MSIEVEEAIKAIQDMTTMIDPEEDFLTIVAAEERFAASEDRRKKELDEAHANLKALSKALEAARGTLVRPKSVPSAQAHTAALNELDSSRLALAKSISDAEALLASQETELAALKEETQNLEQYDPATEHEKELDGTPIRLKIYKGIGFEPTFDKNNKVAKVLIRSRSGDIHLFDPADTKSSLACTQQLWKLAAS